LASTGCKPIRARVFLSAKAVTWKLVWREASYSRSQWNTKLRLFKLLWCIILLLRDFVFLNWTSSDLNFCSVSTQKLQRL
jgi:hypothetical protein